MRHKVCHFDTHKFNYLESIATNNDNFSDTTYVIFWIKRHNLCHFDKYRVLRILLKMPLET